MRDALIVAIVLASCLAALRRPWIGVLLWTWLSLMNPHRLTFGFAYSMPLAMMSAVATALGFMFTKERDWPFKGLPVTIFLLFMAWITVSWLNGLDREGDYDQWSKVMKIDLMILIGLSLLRTKQQILIAACVITGSLALLGIKGGIFTIASGGSGRVWGPPGSFIEDNNEFALALVMTIPLLRFLQLRVTGALARYMLLVTMLLCAASALGSQSRGALLALSAMSLVLWWRGRNRVVGGVAFMIVGLAMLSFMPDSWWDRMHTINTYQEDRSAMGRISAWWNAWNLAFDYPTGVGFYAARPELFEKYSPHPDYVHAAHSIYFQVLGNHGFIGLGIFLLLWLSTWIWAAMLRREAARQPETAWCGDLASMCQVSLVGYAVGGAFLSLAYFDLPFNVMMLLVLTRRWVKTRAWESEPAYELSWPRLWPGKRPATPLKG